jgi:hypothetical protein
MLSSLVRTVRYYACKKTLGNTIALILTSLPIWRIGWPYWNEKFAAGAALEEQALIWISAKNIKYSFTENWGIADYGLNGPNLPTDHLFYTHFPSGPDFILALFLKLGFGEVLIRKILIVVSLSSLIFLWLILKKIKIPALLIGATTSSFLWSYPNFWSYTDHYAFAYFYPSLFLGILGFVKVLKNEKNAYKLLVISFTFSYTTAFISFVILATAALAISIFVSEIRKKLFTTTVFVAVSLIAIHLTRNALVLGWEIAVRDLIFTFGNRSFGRPSKGQILPFYGENNIALWGTVDTDLTNLGKFLWKIIVQQFAITVALLAALFQKLNHRSKSLVPVTHFRKFEVFELFIVLIFVVYVWYLIFPQHGKNYPFPPIIHTSFLFAQIAAMIFFVNNLGALTKSMAKNRSGAWALLCISSLAIFTQVQFRDFMRLEISFFSTGGRIPFLITLFYTLYFQFKKLLDNFQILCGQVFVFLLSLLSSVIATNYLWFIYPKSSTAFRLSMIFIMLILCLFFIFSNFIASDKLPSDVLKFDLKVILITLLIGTTWLTEFKTNFLASEESIEVKFSKDLVKSFQNLPTLKGNVWTNLNAALLFRYTGGNVVGYCTEQGILELNSTLCSSGRFSHPEIPLASKYIVLSKIFPSGDSACFEPDPCFGRLISSLTKTHLTIDISENFFIFKEP